MLHPGAAPSCTISSSGDGVGATRWVNNHDDDDDDDDEDDDDDLVGPRRG